MAEPLVLSSSSVNTFLRCPRQWYHAYVERRRRPPSLKMARGIAGHTAIEYDLNAYMVDEVHQPTEAVVATFVDEYDKVAQETESDAKEKGELKDGGVRAVRHWSQAIAPAVEPVLVEQNGQFVINDVHYDWTADLKDRDGKVRDWKFSGRKPSGGSDYVLNMIGYAVGLRQVTGEVETGVQLDYMVCTKKPYHEPVSSGVVPDDAIDEFGAIVRGVHDQIQAGFFPPNGLQGYGVCDWCGYSDGTCTAYRSRR
jgi:hypothetical protein